MSYLIRFRAVVGVFTHNSGEGNVEEKASDEIIKAFVLMLLLLVKTPTGAKKFSNSLANQQIS